jgi:hypothetical protein
MRGHEPPVGCRNLTLQVGVLANPLVEALAGQHRKLALGHVSPIAMLGRVAEILANYSKFQTVIVQSYLY